MGGTIGRRRLPHAGLESVRARIAAAAIKAANRAPSEVTLIAVSKSFPAAAILPVLEAGHLRLRGKPRAGGQGRSGRRCASGFPGWSCT